VIDPASQAVLADVFRRTRRSLLQYVRDSFPWTTPGKDEGLTRLHELAREEEEAIARLARFFARQHLPVPYPGSYPSSFTTINFIGLGHLQKLLVDYQRQEIAYLAHALSLVRDAEARAQIQALLDLKRQQLSGLEKLHEPIAAPAEPVAHH